MCDNKPEEDLLPLGERAGDHKGPPCHSSPPSPLRELKFPRRDGEPSRRKLNEESYGSREGYRKCRKNLLHQKLCLRKSGTHMLYAMSLVRLPFYILTA